MKPAETLVLTRDTGAIALPLSTNRVLRNTYWLLSLTLLFSAGAAAVAAALQLPHPGIVVTLIGYFGLLFLTVRLRRPARGKIFIPGGITSNQEDRREREGYQTEFGHHDPKKLSINSSKPKTLSD